MLKLSKLGRVIELCRAREDLERQLGRLNCGAEPVVSIKLDSIELQPIQKAKLAQMAEQALNKRLSAIERELRQLGLDVDVTASADDSAPAFTAPAFTPNRSEYLVGGLTGVRPRP